MSENVNIKHIEDSVSNIGTKQICIETGNDSQTGHRMWAGKDSAGDTYKFLGKGKPAYIQNLNIAEFTTAGLLRTDAIGDIFGDVNTLGELNTALGGTTIDESTDARPPDPHATDHTDGTDDIQDATALQKGIMTAAQAAQLIQNTSDISTAQSDISTNSNDITTNAGAISVNQSNISTNTTNISTNAGDITTNADYIEATTPSFAFAGDSITAAAVSYVDNLALAYPDYNFYKYATAGREATFLWDHVLKSCGTFRWRFKDSYYPWVSSGTITFSISDESLEILQPATPATDYLEMFFLPLGYEMTISGNYTAPWSSRLKLATASNSNLLTTTAGGDFSVTYTSVASFEQLQLTVVSGSIGDPIYLNEIQVTLTDQSLCAKTAVGIFAGINDINSTTPKTADQIVEALAFCADMVSESGKRPLVAHITPFRGHATWTQEKETTRLAANTGIDSINAEHMGSDVVGLGDAMRAECTTDLLHPNTHGQIVLSEEFAKNIFGENSIKNANAISAWGAPIDEIANPDTDKIYKGITRENLLIYPEDLTESATGEWEQSSCVIGGATDVIATASATTHVRYQAFDFKALTYTFVLEALGLRADWIRVALNSGVQSAYLYYDTTNEAVGNTQNLDDYRVVKMSNGNYRIAIEVTATDDTGLIGIYPASSGTSVTYTGNGVDADVYATKMHLFEGTIDENIGYINNGAEKYQAKLVLEKSDDISSKHAAGYALKADGNWARIEDVTAMEMDESQPNVSVMHAAGIYKVVSDNTWGPLVAGTQFYAPSGNFLELFEDTSVASGAHTLTPSATPPTDNLASPIHSTGTVYHANYAVMVPSYTSATTFSGLKNNGTEMQLVFSTDGYTTALGYRIEVEYEWRAIVAPS